MSNILCFKEPDEKAVYIDLSFLQEMDKRITIRGTRYHNDGEEKVSVERGWRRGSRKGRGCGKQERGALVRMEDKQATADSAQSSIYDPYAKEVRLQLS